ncbi:UNVERIFIED_CONTAM: hypothetical protein Slati_3742500 [Sesamum latifolium]|uniref:Uncharacterized protein n=1 Tax=Sesamum latifolium TaxID=2727402 RepID=A0AAW2U4S3_9LAMI
MPTAYPTYSCSSRTPQNNIITLPILSMGMDIVGPFPAVARQRKFLLMAVDYFSKWVEAKPLA